MPYQVRPLALCPRSPNQPRERPRRPIGFAPWPEGEREYVGGDDETYFDQAWRLFRKHQDGWFTLEDECGRQSDGTEWAKNNWPFEDIWLAFCI